MYRILNSGDVFSELDRMQREVQRRTSDRRRAAAKRADAVLHNCRVAVQHQDVFHIHAQRIRGDLRERGLLALTVRRNAGHHRDLA